MAQPQRHYSLDDYFVVETDSVIKHEYYRGEIFAMAGASVAHNHITANVLAFLRYALRGKGRRGALASRARRPLETDSAPAPGSGGESGSRRHRSTGC